MKSILSNWFKHKKTDRVEEGHVEGPALLQHRDEGATFLRDEIGRPQSPGAHRFGTFYVFIILTLVLFDSNIFCSMKHHAWRMTNY